MADFANYLVNKLFSMVNLVVLHKMLGKVVRKTYIENMHQFNLSLLMKYVIEK